MKTLRNNIFMTMVVLYAFFPASTMAQYQVPCAEAIRVAQKFSILYFPSYDTTIQDVYSKTNSEGDTLIFEIKMRGGQTVLVSGDYRLKPVFGYIENGTNISLLQGNDLPNPLKMLLEGYENSVEYLIGMPSVNYRANDGWNMILSSAETSTRTSNHLVTSLWGQSKSNDSNDPCAYNSQAPVVDGCKSRTGSAAVAMGQLMNYWKYPNFRTSDYDLFDWCRMPDKLETNNECYDVQKYAVSSLLNKCGTASNTHYGCDYSETSKYDVRNALRNSFHFKVGNYLPIPILGIVNPETGLPEPMLDMLLVLDFQGSLMDEIDRGRPMIGYSVESGKKYYFLCDGYVSHGGIDVLFHFNWGWNGTSDMWFDVFSLNPINHSFSPNLEILVGIEPKVDMTEYENILDLNFFYNDYSSLLSTIPPYELVPGTSEVLISADTTSLESRRTIAGGEVSVYQAFREVVLRPGFTAERGSDFTARIEPCEMCETAMLELRMGEEDASEEAQADTSLMPRMYRMGDTTYEVRQSALRLYPNPTEQQLTIGTTEDVKDIRLYDQRGHAVYRWYVSRRGADGLTLEVGEIPTGTYIIHVTTLDGRTHIGRFVKK